MANFTGTSGPDNLVGTSGDDFFDMSQGGNDTVSGGDGDDEFFFGATLTAFDKIDGGTDTSSVDGGINIVELQGDYSAGLTFHSSTVKNIGEIFLGGAFTYNLTMNDGNLAAGGQMIIGASQNATVTIDASAELDGSYSLFGGAGNDRLTGGASDDQIRGRNGDDLMHGGNGNDYLNGGLGDDLYDGGAGKNRAAFYDGTGSITHGVTVSLLVQGVAQNTQDGMDTLVNIQDLSGTPFDDALDGDNNANWLWGEGGNDDILGHSGDDVIYVGPLASDTPLGTDIANGGGGVDTLSFYDNSTLIADVTFSLALQGTSQSTGVDTITATNFENVSGSESGDTLSGDSHGNAIYGDAGNDTLAGGAGNDGLYGDKAYEGATDAGFGNGGPTGAVDVAAPGDDTLTGGAGNDTLDGGGGNDTALYSDATGGVTVSLLNEGLQHIGGGDGKDALISIENVVGSNFDDQLSGDGNNNVLTGLDGNDRITGANGSDTLDGGNGSDTFIYAIARESTSTAHDVIIGFDADSDSIQVPGAVKGIDPTVTSGALDEATFDADLQAAIGAGQMGAKHAVLFTPDSGSYAGDMILIINADGVAGYQAGSDLVIELQGAANLADLSAADFH